jgi:hypothetical protein
MIARSCISRRRGHGLHSDDARDDVRWLLDSARKSGSRLIQQDVLVPYNGTVGVQRSFAEAVNIYIEKKLTE